MDWNHKPYHSLDSELRRQFQTKVYKIALDGGMTCPNRDGSIGTRGCLFCSAGGSGDFAARPMFPSPAPVFAPGEAPAAFAAGRLSAADLRESVRRQIEEAAARIRPKLGASAPAYIAYFQAYTNTYAPLPYLRELFTAAIRHPDVRVLSVATRPDCLSDGVLDLCAKLNRQKPVWLELGLQTIHPQTAGLIRRGFPLSCFEDALRRLRARNLTAVVHVILGLPGETRDMMLDTVRYLASRDIQGVKLQLLHVLAGTDLAALFEKEPFPVFTLEEYLDLVIDCVALLPPDIVIHRLTGDGPKKLLLAPLWSANKRLVLNSLTRRFRERGVTQGCALLTEERSAPHHQC